MYLSFIKHLPHYMSPVILILLICVFPLFNSCKTEKKEVNSRLLTVKVLHASGDDYTYYLNDKEHEFMPYPLNHAYLINNDDTCDVYILSKRLEVNTEVDIEPFLELDFVNIVGQSECVVLARLNNTDSSLSNIFEESSDMEYLYSAVHMIEYWHSNRRGLNGSQLILKKTVSHKDYHKK